VVGGEDTRREREGVIGWAEITGGSVLGGFVGLGLGCLGVFRLGANGWRGLPGVTISTASIIILVRTGVVGLGGTCLGTGSSSSSPSGSPSSTTVGIPFVVVRGRVALVVDFEGPAFALIVRADIRVDVLEEGLVEGGLVGGGLVAGGFFDGGFT